MGWFSGPDATLTVDFFDDPRGTSAGCRANVRYSRRTEPSTEQAAKDFAGYTNCVMMASPDGSSVDSLRLLLSQVLNSALESGTQQTSEPQDQIQLVPAAPTSLLSCGATFTDGKMPKVSLGSPGLYPVAVASCIAWLQQTVQELPKEQLVRFADLLHTPLRLHTRPSLGHLLAEAEDRLLAKLVALPPNVFVRDWGFACVGTAASFWNVLLLDADASTLEDGTPLNVFQLERDRLTAEGVDELFRLFITYRLQVFCISEDNQQFIRRVEAFVENFIDNVAGVFDLNDTHVAVYEDLLEPDPSVRYIKFFNAVSRLAFGMEPSQDSAQVGYFVTMLSNTAKLFMDSLDRYIAQRK